jgi:tetratricopeptide (TPR) repeat protein
MNGWPRTLVHWAVRRRIVLLVLIVGIGLAGYLGQQALVRSWQRRAVLRALACRDFSEARSRLERCLRSSTDDAEWLLLAARAARGEGDFAEANRHLERCQRVGGNARAIGLERAMIVCQAGDPTGVEKYLHSRLAEEPPETELILEALAQGYLKTRRLPEALECLERWLQRQPDHVQALLWRGQVLEWWNDLEEALRSYRKAVVLDPNHEKARRLLALALVRSDLAEEALTHLETLRQTSDDPEILLGQARGRRCLGQVEEARRLLDLVLTAQPNNAEALTEQGKLGLQTGKPEQAEQALKQALTVAPFDREANYTYYLCLRQLGREDEAGRRLEKVEQIRADLQRVSELRRKIAASPRDPSLRCEVGVLFLRNGQTSEGIRWLQSALQLAPDHAESRRVLAQYANHPVDPQKR